jgi:protein SCO1/2
MLDREIIKKVTVSAMLSALLVTGNGTAGAHDRPDHKPSAVKSQAANGNLTKVRLFDLEVIDHEGKPAKFRSDVIGDRIVVMDFVYTTCTTVCPVLTAIMGQVQERLGERLSKDVFLHSLSVDPIIDTPQRLKAYARRHKSRWSYWTGHKAAVDRVLEGLGTYAPDFIDHLSLIMVGDGKTGDWTRFYGFVSPDQILAKVDELLAGRDGAVSMKE